DKNVLSRIPAWTIISLRLYCTAEKTKVSFRLTTMEKYPLISVIAAFFVVVLSTWVAATSPSSPYTFHSIVLERSCDISVWANTQNRMKTTCIGIVRTRFCLFGWGKLDV